MKSAKRQKGELPLSPVLLLALVVIPLVIGLIFFMMSAEDRVMTESKDLTEKRKGIDRATDRLEQAFEK